MAPNSPADSSRKRKGKGIAEAEPSAPPQPAPLSAATQNFVDNALLAVSTDISIGNDPSLPNSFTALLNAPHDDYEFLDYPKLLSHQMDEIDRLIQSHREDLRSGLADMWEKHHREIVTSLTKKLKEKEVEVQTIKQIAEYHKKNAQTWEVNAKARERSMTSLRACMHLALKHSPGENKAELGDDEAESSFVDPGPMESSVKCIMCDKKPAKLMLWPCRHVAVCLSCEVITQICPLCATPKARVFKVNLP